MTDGRWYVVGGRWRSAGFRIHESGVRSQNEEYLLPAFCFPPSAFCLLLSAFCFPPSAFCLLLSAFCFPPSAFCLLLFAFCFPPTAYCIWGAAARAKDPPRWSLSPGNLSGLICFVSKCRLSGRLKEESLSSRWG